MMDVIPKNIHTHHYRRLTTDGINDVYFQDLGHKTEVPGRFPDLSWASQVPQTHKLENM